MLEVLNLIRIIDVVYAWAVRIKVVVPHEISHFIFYGIILGSNLEELSEVGHVMYIVFDVVSNILQRFMSDASVLLHAIKI